MRRWGCSPAETRTQPTCRRPQADREATSSVAAMKYSSQDGRSGHASSTWARASISVDPGAGWPMRVSEGAIVRAFSVFRRGFVAYGGRDGPPEASHAEVFAVRWLPAACRPLPAACYQRQLTGLHVSQVLEQDPCPDRDEDRSPQRLHAPAEARAQPVPHRDRGEREGAGDDADNHAGVPNPHVEHREREPDGERVN